MDYKHLYLGLKEFTFDDYKGQNFNNRDVLLYTKEGMFV